MTTIYEAAIRLNCRRCSAGPGEDCIKSYVPNVADLPDKTKHISMHMRRQREGIALRAREETDK